MIQLEEKFGYEPEKLIGSIMFRFLNMSDPKFGSEPIKFHLFGYV